MLDLGHLAAAVGGTWPRWRIRRAERRTGYVVGGISPIGQKTRYPTVLDETAELYDTVFGERRRRGLDLEQAPGDLIRVTGSPWLLPLAGR